MVLGVLNDVMDFRAERCEGVSDIRVPEAKHKEL